MRRMSYCNYRTTASSFCSTGQFCHVDNYEPGPQKKNLCGYENCYRQDATAVAQTSVKAPNEWLQQVRSYELLHNPRVLHMLYDLYTWKWHWSLYKTVGECSAYICPIYNNNKN